MTESLRISINICNLGDVQNIKLYYPSAQPICKFAKILETCKHFSKDFITVR